MSLAAFLTRVIKILDESRIKYMLTGSLAAAYYAAPRATQDVDLVIEAEPGALDRAIERMIFEGLYVSPEAAQKALATEGQFNAIDPDQGWKVDLIIRKDRPFSASEFSRRERAELLGIEVSLATVEDLILAKLEWSSLGSSERQLRDVIELISASYQSLDRAYIAKWAAELGIEDAWRAALAAAGES